MVSTIKSVQQTILALQQAGVQQVVLSPGSRNAPFTFTLHHHSDFECMTVIDERSAGFMALGMAQASGRPVAVCCTSGSAVLNYAPAICEAYYQGIPLIVVTADRPNDWNNDGEGQSINQKDVFQNYIGSSCELAKDEDDYSNTYNINELQRTLNVALSDKLPAHINVPLREPLYNHQESFTVEAFPALAKRQEQNEEYDLQCLKEDWNNAQKRLIICGQLPKEEKLKHLISSLAIDGRNAILTESTANLAIKNTIGSIDRTIVSIENEFIEAYQPDIIITLGGPIISKKIKALFRKQQPNSHYHLGPEVKVSNIFNCLTAHLPGNRNDVLAELANSEIVEAGVFRDKWLQLSLEVESRHDAYIPSAKWSDLKAFHHIIDYIPDGMDLHMGNSSPVRYVQLFNSIPEINYHGNRGVSGIDGCTSTAVGISLNNNRNNVLVTGDLGFVYDCNALWNLPKCNLKIIVINNGGGGIFKIIPGPSSTGALAERFEVGNNCEIEHLAKAHQANYQRVESEAGLESILPAFFQLENDSINILEVVTPSGENDLILKAYFEAIKLP